MAEEALVADTPEGSIAGYVGSSGTPLLLPHGGPAISDYMDMLGPEVGGWRAVRYQQRGLAPSAVSGPFTVERHCADAVAVLDTLGIGRALVGTSSPVASQPRSPKSGRKPRRSQGGRHDHEAFTPAGGVKAFARP